MARGGEEIAGDAGGCRGVRAAEDGVAGEGEMEFVDEVEAGEFADEFAAAFAVEMADVVFGHEEIEECAEVHVMDGDGWWDHWLGGAGDEEVDGTTGGGEDGMGGIEISAVRDDAAQGMVRGGHRHAVVLEGAATDDDGIGLCAESEEAVVVGL